MRLSSKQLLTWKWKSSLLAFFSCLAVAAFLFSGLGTISLSAFKTTTNDPYVAAQVDSEKISMEQLHESLLQHNLTSEKAIALSSPQTWFVLQQQILELLKAQQAKVWSLQPTQQKISYFIRTIPAFADPNTHTFSFAIFKNYTSSVGEEKTHQFYQEITNLLAGQNIDTLTQFTLAMPESVENIERTWDKTITTQSMLPRLLSQSFSTWLLTDAYSKKRITINAQISHGS